jgi:cardiolipin synthase
LNNRTHRKVLIIDGALCFTGGVGIADQWSRHAQDPGHWRDMHFKVTGPVAAQMQTAFLDNWIKTTGHVLHGDAYFPHIEPSGDQDMQMFMRNSRDVGPRFHGMSVQHFGRCRPGISRHVGPAFHGMSVQFVR